MVMVRFVPSAMSVANGGLKNHTPRQFTFLSGAQVMTGAVVSRTVTICVQLTALLQPSNTLQVRVAVYVNPHGPKFVLVLTTATFTFVPMHKSLPVGRSKFHAVPYSMVLFGAHETVGGVVSMAVTVCAQTVRLLQESISSQVRVAVKPQVPV